MAENETLHVQHVKAVDAPLQHETALLPELLEASKLIRVSEARETFKVDGAGVTVAVLDTGLRTSHVDFAGRVLAQKNFTADNGGDADDASDGQGHGTNVAGIICAGDIHIGMAPGSGVIPIKVLGNEGGGSFDGIQKALQWVLDNHAEHAITAVCMSLGDSGNYQTDDSFANDAVGNRIKALRQKGVAVCIAAGNDYFAHNSVQGMSYPAIFRDCVSVGAVYDEDVGAFSYQSGAAVTGSGPDRITPFSQRLHEKAGKACSTDIFAPGAPMTSSGILNDTGESVQHGTSQATPVITGVVLLLQSYHLRVTGKPPSVEQVLDWLTTSAKPIQDGDDEQDNVLHTGLTFRRVDAFGALSACARSLAKASLEAAARGPQS
ncbi:S8 family serine peptidase [uncultured Phenylobacterium sp.]|uniref:S8 family peptidase n=1 Tax=uncultured Phenylobacterium sp. TaxID=349273 RepID=UPI0025FBDA9F|nr:S8 family serine peptidase [uncultured Phenylobacterium sp.]